MRVKGICYDTGVFPGGRESRPGFDPADLVGHLELIAGNLACDAVRITGGDLGRIALAAQVAADLGLEVWFSPHPSELGIGALTPYLDEAARRAEALRRRAGNDVVLVLGCELSVFAAGFLPGRDAYARMASLAAPPPELLRDYESVVGRLNEVLASSAGTARTWFRGPITYAAGPWEQVDWAPFDIVAVDLYRDATNADGYAEELRALRSAGKPVAITEFGCATFRGAADLGALGWTILEGEGIERRVMPGYQRDEAEQAGYLTELLDQYEAEGVDAAFWFSFASFDKPRRNDPGRDLDLASFGVIAVGEDGTLTPKASFDALARRDRAGRRG